MPFAAWAVFHADASGERRRGVDEAKEDVKNSEADTKYVEVAIQQYEQGVYGGDG